jgi:hypothetical protein
LGINLIKNVPICCPKDVNSKILFPIVEKLGALCSELDVQAQPSVTEFKPMTSTNLAIPRAGTQLKSETIF